MAKRDEDGKLPAARTVEHDNTLTPKQLEKRKDIEENGRKLRPGEIKWLSIPDEEKPQIGGKYKGVTIVSFDERGYPIGDNSRNLVLGYVVKGNTLAKNGGGGRPKGSRNKLTQEMIEMVARQNVSPAEFLANVINNPEWSLDNQIKAAMKLTDIVYPKAASVELEVINDEADSGKEIDDRIKELLGSIKFSLDND